MGEAGLAEELRHGKCPRARAVAGRSAGFQFGSPFGHRRVGPAECPGDFLQLPGKGKWPGFSAFDPLQRAVAVVKTGQEKLRARADRQGGDPVKERIEVIRPGLPERRRSSSLGDNLSCAHQASEAAGICPPGDRRRRFPRLGCQSEACSLGLPAGESLRRAAPCASSRERADRCEESARLWKNSAFVIARGLHPLMMIGDGGGCPLCMRPIGTQKEGL